MATTAAAAAAVEGTPRPRAWDAKLPHDQRYGEKGWRALETYDRWLRGQPVMACVSGKDFSEPYAFEEACYVESPYDACTLNSVLGRALYSPPAYHGDCFRPRFDDELDRFVFDIDTRRGVESEFAAFARCGHEVPPCTDELKDLMLQAAQRRPRVPQRWCDMGQPRSEHHWQSDWLNDKLEAQRAGRDPPQQEIVDADDDGGVGGGSGSNGAATTTTSRSCPTNKFSHSGQNKALHLKKKKKKKKIFGIHSRKRVGFRVGARLSVSLDPWTYVPQSGCHIFCFRMPSCPLFSVYN
jgi:hypothetical protein